MRIDLQVSVAGPGLALPAGIHEVDDAVGEMLVKAGHAKRATKRGRKRGGSDDVGDSTSAVRSGEQSAD